MAWIESHQDLARHPKTRKLAMILGIEKPAAIGHLHLLWWWALDYADDGNLSAFDATDIAIGAEWEGDAQQFVEGLQECGSGGTHGFLTDDLQLRNWHEYAGKLIERRKANRNRMRKARATHVRNTCRATEPDRTQPTKPMSSFLRSEDSSAPNDAKPANGSTRGESVGEEVQTSANPTPGSEPQSQVVLEYPTVGKVDSWQLSEAQVAEWATLYPGLDVLAECRKAMAWIKANPGRRKTARGMPRFLTNWLNRATDSPRRGSADSRQRAPVGTDDERRRQIAALD